MVRALQRGTRPAQSRQAGRSAVAHPVLVSRSRPFDHIHVVQQSVGNRATARWLRAQGLQPALTVNPAGDVFEREAEGVAANVMRDAAGVQRQPVTVGRVCQQCDEDQPRRSLEKEQGVRASPAGPDRPDATPRLESYLNASRGAGHPLPTSARAYFAPRFGHDFGGVRVHTGGGAARAAADINALAFTTGADIHFAPGRFRPGTSDGDRLLAHELTHVLQQRGGGSVASAQPVSVQRQFGDPFGLPGPELPESDVDCSVDLAARKWQDFVNCCAKTPLGKGCSKDVIAGICKIPGVNCGDKPPGPILICPPGFKPGATRDHKGQCCDERQTAEDSRWCCAPSQIVTKAVNPRCCPPGTSPDARSENCVTPRPEPKPDLCLPGQKTTKGACCRPPMIPRGDSCVLPPPPPPPPVPTALAIEFRQDRPLPTSTLEGSLTEKGRESLDALVKQLQANTSLKVQLIGRASPEGLPDYNMALGRRRAEMIASALADKGIAEGRIADAPEPVPFSPCKDIRTGIVTCGESDAHGPEDRQVLPRLFLPNP